MNTQPGLTHISTIHAIEIPEWLFTRSRTLSKDPSEVRYTCAVCGIQEPFAFANGYRRRPCACEKTALEAQQQGMIIQVAKVEKEAQRAAKTYTWLGKDAEEIGLEAKNFTDFDPKAQPDRRRFLERKMFASQYASRLVEKQEVENLLFTSKGWGTGKTHLAAAICNTLRASGIGCLFCTAQSFFNALYAADFDEKQHLQSLASTTPLLVFDDLDKLHVRADTDGAFQKRTLFDIVDKRYKRKLPTIITTNEQADLSPWMDGATISRLMEHMTVLDMTGIDYRLPKGGKQ